MYVWVDRHKIWGASSDPQNQIYMTQEGERFRASTVNQAVPSPHLSPSLPVAGTLKMPPKAPPSAGAKKKIVRTVRKIVPKSKTPLSEAKTPVPEATPPTPTADEPQQPSDALTPSTTASTITTPTTSPPIDTATPDAAPKASEPAAAETPAAAEPAAVESTPEPSEPAATAAVESTPEPAVTEVPVSEPAAQGTTPEPSEPAATKPATKPTTRIVKKIVKKVVVKRVPKGSAAAAAAAKKVDEKAVVSPPAAQDSLVQPKDGDASAEEKRGDAAAAAADAAGGGDEMLSEGRRRRKTEIFIGGLDRGAKEEDVRKVFGRVGEVAEVRMMMDNKTGKNKGYAFLRYADVAQAKRAVSELAKVEVCGKLCGAAALEGNDTIFLGNIDKKWKKEDISKLLHESGIEKIDSLTLMPDPNNTEMNRGFAFLELETNRDAQLAYKKLQKKDVFGKGRNVKVSWAEPLNDPDEQEMQKVKSVYADGIPSSWNEDKVREVFKKFGEIERIVLARNIQSAKRKDFAFVNYTTRESALSCIELFDKEELTDSGSKINVKVSFAKPVQKDKQNKGGPKPGSKDKIKEKPKVVEYNAKVDESSNRGKPFKGGYTTNYGDKKSSTTSELLHVLREQAAWKQDQIGYARASTVQDYTHALPGGKRPFASLDDATHSDYLRGYPRPRLDSSFPITTSSSYGGMHHGVGGSSLSYYQRYAGGFGTGAPDHSSNLEGRRGGPPYGRSNPYY